MGALGQERVLRLADFREARGPLCTLLSIREAIRQLGGSGVRESHPPACRVDDGVQV